MDINVEAQQFEGLCEQYYRQPDNAQLFERLNHFQTSPESVQKLCFFMERCQNPYACLFGARCISSLISSHWEYFKTENRSSALLHFILGFVWQNGPRVGEVITKVLIQAYCKVSKLESITNEKTFNDLKLSVTRFLQSEAIEHRILGLEFYKQLLEEINTRCNTLTIAQHRKVAIKFRDEFLLDLLLDLIANLTVIKNNPSCELNPLLEKYIDRSVELIIGIFNFDFIGTNMNDSVEDLGPIQVPSAWKPTFESLPNVNLFFELYIKFSTSSKSPRILEAISLLASVKSSIFTPKGLTDYIAALMKGIQEIMQKCRESLQNTDNHHQLSRVLARFKTSFLTRNFHQIDFYRPWITLVSEFTSHSFANWNLFSNSILYLLTFWSKLFAPCDTKNDNTQLYEEISFRLFNDYLDSHLKSVPYVISNSLDEPLEQIDALQEELDKLAEVARYNYFQVSRSVMQRLGEFSVQFEKMAVTYGADPVLECQLAWLVYVTAAMINGRSPYPPSADVQTPNLDGDLSARVILLLRVHDNRLPRITAESVDFVIHAERSFLQFFSSFRKVYFGELMNPVVKVFERLSELVGVKSNTKTLELIIMKVTSNLVCWSNQPFIISKTLELFKDLTSGYNISKQITKLEIIDNLLQHHTSERFSFLDNPSNFKSRTSYYTTLGRILFNNKNLDRFDAFMAPFSQRFQILMNNQLSPADSKLLLVGLFRDLIGIMLACQTREIYETLFEWLYPNLTMMMGNAAEIYFEDPDVISPLLKLTDQLTSNIMGRLAFPNSSPNGILLFREISNIIVRYGRKLLLLEVPEKKEYRCKFKGIRMCMEILSRASRGNYVNFATFELYNDPTLSDFISIVTKLALSIPTNKLFSYPKVLVSFYNMLEVICQAHFFKYIVTNERNALPQLFDLLFEGIRRIELNVFNESCNAMDNIVASFITAKKRNQEVAQILSSHAASQFPRFVNLFFQMLLYVDTASPWTIAKPLLGLILIDTSEMNSVCQSLMVSQKEENQQKIFELFQNLTTGISNTLLAQNRDVFTHNINNFRRDIKNFITL